MKRLAHIAASGVIVVLALGLGLAQEKQHVDLIVSGGIVVTMDSTR